MTPLAKTLAELAREVGGEVVGDGDVKIYRVAAIEEAGPGEITFLPTCAITLISMLAGPAR